MNKLITIEIDGKPTPCVMDASGKPWPRGVAHKGKLPEGIEYDDSNSIAWVCFFRDGAWRTQPDIGDTHWIMPLPVEIPKETT